MGKLLELRQRIRAVENIAVVTRTLATVAAAKLARTRRRAAGMRLYSRSVRDMLARQQSVGALGALLRPREPVRTVAVLVVTADRGMCGGYNLDASRCALDFWNDNRTHGVRVMFVLRGKRGGAYFTRRKAEIRHQDRWPRAGPGPRDVERLLDVVLPLYRSGAVDAVYAVYTQFFSPIHRRPRVVRMLPVEIPTAPEASVPEATVRWHYEPTRRETLEELLTVYLRIQLYDVLLESYASEQGARMITMQEATERATKTLQDLRVQHHRLRREAITIDLLQTLFAGTAAES